MSFPVILKITIVFLHKTEVNIIDTFLATMSLTTYAVILNLEVIITCRIREPVKETYPVRGTKARDF